MGKVHDKFVIFCSMNSIKFSGLLNNEIKKENIFYSFGNSVVESLPQAYPYKPFNKTLSIEFTKLFSVFYNKCEYGLYYKLDRNYIIKE